jgi:hypothetical protein
MFPLPQPEDDRDRDDGHEADEPMELGAFLARVEEESRRHHRYLRGYGLVRIAAVDGLRGREALEEALQTETRRTDTVCALPDGSFAILCVESGLDACLALAKRLQVVAMELSPGSESLVPFPAGVAASNVVRVRADELWAAASHCFARARQSTTGMVWLPGGD